MYPRIRLENYKPTSPSPSAITIACILFLSEQFNLFTTCFNMLADRNGSQPLIAYSSYPSVHFSCHFVYMTSQVSIPWAKVSDFNI